MYIEYNTINGAEYARLRLSVRNGATVSHHKSITLGRVLDKQRMIFKSREHGVYQYDIATGKRMPPPEDFDIKVVRKNAREILIVDFGNVNFFQKYIERKNLRSVIDSVGYGNPDSFNSLLSYYLLERASNAHAEDWYEGSYTKILYPKALMQSQRISDMLEALGDENVYRNFFSSYIAFIKQSTKEASKGAILIDSTGFPNSSRLPVTAISNHNGEINNEVRLIYVVQRGTGLPIYMRYVSGNIVDVSTLLTTIAELKAMKVDTKFAILDAGYLTLDSIDVLLENKISFLSRLKKNWTLYKQIIKEHLASLKQKANMHLYNGSIVHLKRIQATLPSGKTVYAYLGIDDDIRWSERKQIAKVADEDELSVDDIQAKLEKAGVFILLSSRRIATQDLLPLYSSRQDIEQVFDISNSYAKALPLCVQSEEIFRGHLLMVFISTIILRMLQQDLKSTTYSLDDVIMIMKNQKAKVFDDRVVPLEPTKKQNDLYKLIGVKHQTSISR